MFKKILTTSAVFLIILLFLGLPVTQANNEIIRTVAIEKDTNNVNNIRFSVNDTLPPRPILSVVKTMNGSIVSPNVIQVQPNETIRVDVRIKNVGNRTAYNLTTTDPGFEDWALTSLNLTTQRFIKVGINATIYYFYYFTAVIEGNFTISATTIDYMGVEDSEISEYNARSHIFYILSIEERHVAIIEASLWVKMLYYCLAIGGSLGIVVTVDIVILRRKTTTKRPAKKQPTKAEISKQQQKRKIKKRR